jgi:hypothetical protein
MVYCTSPGWQMMMILGQLEWMIGRETEVLREDRPQYRSGYHRYLTWHAQVSNPGRRNCKPETNRLSCVRAPFLLHAHLYGGMLAPAAAVSPICCSKIGNALSLLLLAVNRHEVTAITWEISDTLRKSGCILPDADRWLWISGMWHCKDRPKRCYSCTKRYIVTFQNTANV